MVFIAHVLPKGLRVDEVVTLGPRSKPPLVMAQQMSVVEEGRGQK